MLTKKKLKVVYDLKIPSMIPVRKIAIKKARKDLKWSPKTTLYEGLKKTISWFKKLMIITKTPYRISFLEAERIFQYGIKKIKAK